MKKFLSILSAVGLTATASTSVVACGNSKEENKSVEDKTPITNLQKEKEAAEKELNAINKKIGEKDTLLIAYNDEIKKQEKLITDATNKVKGLETQQKTILDNLKNAKDVLENQNKNKGLVESLQKVLTDAAKDLPNNSDAKVLIAGLKDLVESVNKQIEQTTRSIDKFKQQAEEVQESLNNANTELTKTTSEANKVINTQKQKIEVANTEKKSLTQQKTNCETKIKELQDQIDALIAGKHIYNITK